MKKLSLIDVAFLANETRRQPMHVGGLSLYSLPEGADEQTFLQDFASILRDVDEFQRPFGERLKTGPLGLAGQVFWERDSAMDIAYHIRHSALPRPGRYRELFTLVSRLHGTLLDRERPLWEMHLIEGLQNRQFAVYMKTHHAAIDGVRSIHLARSMLSNDPRAPLVDSPLSLAAGERYREALQRTVQPDLDDEALRNVADALKASFDSGTQLVGALRRASGAWLGRGGALKLPFMEVPRSAINTPVDGARRFVAQSWTFARLRRMGRAFDGTFNDAVLAMCAGALRRYMQNYTELPPRSLKAMVPVSLRREGDLESSNAIGSISVDLATDMADPVKRFAAIQASARAGKDFYAEMSSAEAQLFSTLLQLPGLLLAPLGLASRLPPFNTIISNVPGPQEPMYWNGARLDGMYPASIVTEGIALNITLVSAGENVDFGITACRRSLPHAQRLIDYMEDALVELEEAAGLSEAAAGRKAPKKPPGREKASAAKKKAPAAKKKRAAAKRKAPAAKKTRAGAKKKATATGKKKTAARKKAPVKKASSPRKRPARGNTAGR
jgi:WS/DGAT/MGAT family acyltransferase